MLSGEKHKIQKYKIVGDTMQTRCFFFFVALVDILEFNMLQLLFNFPALLNRIWIKKRKRN